MLTDSSFGPTQRTAAGPATALDAPPIDAGVLPRLWVEPWPDVMLDATGHDPRSPYVERFWLGILGPSTTWLLRAIAHGFEQCPEGFDLPLVETARALGLGSPHGQHSVFRRSITRLTQFDLANHCPDGTLLARRTVPWLGRRQLALLPVAIQHEHSSWEESDNGAGAQSERLRRRAHHVARTLVEAGHDVDDVERGLARSEFPTVLVRSAADWAWQRHYGVIPERDDAS